MEPAGVSKQQENQQKKLFGLIFFRILTITVLMGSTTILNFRTSASWSPTQQLILYSIGIIYLLSIFYLLAVKYNTSYRFQAAAQLFADLLFWSCLIYLTDGLHSPFSFLYSLSIIYGSILLGRQGAFATFATSFVLFIVVIWFESNGIFHETLHLSKSFVHILDISEIYQLFLNFCMLMLITMLAVFLAKEMATHEEILVRERMSLRIQKMMNRSIVTGITSGFVMMDLSGNITFFNVAAEKLSNKFTADALGQTLTSIFPDLHDAITKELRGEKWNRYIEIPFEMDDEQHKWLAITFSDLMGIEDERMGSVVLIDDITERKNLEQRLFRNSKLAAVGELAAGIAHEIRNPLASISGSIQILRSEFPPGDDNEKLMEIVLRETDRLNTLIDDFLTFARPKPLSIAPINLREIMEDITE